MTKDLAGKVFLMTGATEGIGKAAALDFAKRGAELTIVGRNKDKTERVASELAAAGAGSVAVLMGDLSKVADVRAVAAAFRATHDRLDVLVNNAGALFTKHQLSSDGIEMTFALNHVAYFVLTGELLDLLKKTPGARIVSTSSGAHRSGRINFDTIVTRPKGNAGFPVYCDSKLANVLFTRELARRLAGTGVTANCIHPGFVHSGFGQNTPGLMARAINLAGSWFGRTPEKGAESIIWLATSPEAASLNGAYVHDMKETGLAQRGKDDALAAKLWQFSEKLVAAH